MVTSAAGSISLCMIVKNEERNLRACLEPVADLFRERIVVDTGSTDCTQSIAAELGATLSAFRWIDDFAAARNFAIDQATGDWVFWLDADDRVDAANIACLRSLFGTLRDEAQAFVMKTVCVPAYASDTATVISQARLFRRVPGVRWQGRVHEQILPSLQQAGHALVWTDIRIQHVGYQDAALQHRKANRDLRLLRLEYALQPDDPVVLYNLGLTHARLGQHAAALPFLRRSFELSTHRADWMRKLLATLCDVWIRLNRRDQALAVTELGLANFPCDPELSIRRADLLGTAGNLRGAEQCLEALLAHAQPDYLQTGVADDLVCKEARRLLAVVYQDQGRVAEARRLLEALLAEYPDFVQAWVNLAYVLLALQARAAFDDALRELERCPQGRVYAAVLRAERYMAGGDLLAARPLLDEAIASAPRMLWPRIVLSEWLLKNGDDRDGFIAVQRDILRLDPGNAFAQANLQRLAKGLVPGLALESPLGWTITV